MKNTTATHFIEVYASKEDKHNQSQSLIPYYIENLKSNLEHTTRNGFYTVAVFLITPKNKENELKSNSPKGA
jgi:hypothetical protein